MQKRNPARLAPDLVIHYETLLGWNSEQMFIFLGFRQSLMLQKSEGFRAPDDGISASLQQGVKGEVVVVYLESLTTQDLKSSGSAAG